MTLCKLELVDIFMSKNSKLELVDCTFLNSPLDVETDIIVSGTTIFSGTKKKPAISSYYMEEISHFLEMSHLLTTMPQEEEHWLCICVQ